MLGSLMTLFRSVGTWITLAAAILGITVAFVPTFGTWFLQQPLIAWSIVGFLLLSVLVQQWRIAYKKDQIGAISEASGDLTTRCADLEQEVEKLRQRLHPSERDRALFAEIQTLLEPNGPFILWVERSFDPNLWYVSQMKPLYTFLSDHRNSYFDDPAVESALTALKEAAKRFDQWTRAEGDTEYSDVVGDDRVVLARPARRTGGYIERDAAYRRGELLAEEFTGARRQLEQIARERGL
jgi:hypothetical protein